MKNKNRIFGIIAVVSVIAVSFALIACDLAMSADHIAYDISGKWKSSGSSWWQIEVYNKKFILSDSTGASMTVENLKWKEVINTGSIIEISPIDYPKGFEFTGKITKNKNISGTGFSSGQTGVTISRTIYIHNDKNKTIYSGRKDNILIKQ